VTQALWILKALLSHWRRRPFQAVTVFLGLAIATALWSGVQALNAQSRASYDRAAAIVAGEGFAAIEARGGADIAQEDYIALRRAGWPVSPMLQGDISISGETLRLVGIDPLTLPADAGPLTVVDSGNPNVSITQFLLPPSLMLVNPQTLGTLGVGAGQSVAGDDGEVLPPFAVSERVAPGTIVTDIGAAQRILGRPEVVSRLVVTGAPRASLPRLASFADGRLRLLEPQQGGDLDRLTDSFHLNLTAFGFLSFLVGLLIVNAAVGLAFEQRRPMLRTLRACGVSARALTAVMTCELVVIAALAGLAGTVAGYLVASALLPDVAASLRGLYGANVSGELALQPSWWLAGLGMSIAGALAASAMSLWRSWRLPILANAQPHAWATSQRRTLSLQGFAALVLFAAAILLATFGEGLVTGFALMGAILLGAALILPLILAIVLRSGEKASRGPITAWFFADSRQQLGGLSLALMALLLALAVNVGVGTMVGSFRLTFTGWLDQRLASELYFGGDTEGEAGEMLQWLGQQDGVRTILPVWGADTRYRDWPVEVYGFRDDATYRDHWPMLQRSPDLWGRTAAGDAMLVSEQFARRFDLAVGDAITLAAPQGDLTLPVAGVYSDYGNPRGQVMVSVDVLEAHFPDAERLRFAARIDPDRVPEILGQMRERFDVAPGQIVDQRSLKAFSQNVFERTFAVTLALNALTLGVAGAALLASLLSLAAMRLPQLAPVWALGVTRRRLAGIELIRAIGLAVLTAIVALPLGLVVAWVLMSVINVQAFGWQLPLYFFPMQWLQLLGLAILTAFLAALWPAIRLRRTPPAELLKVFADER
jgi:putative ABC transport system permease protein